jgi:hypothetical protein
MIDSKPRYRSPFPAELTSVRGYGANLAHDADDTRLIAKQKMREQACRRGSGRISRSAFRRLPSRRRRQLRALQRAYEKALKDFLAEAMTPMGISVSEEPCQV